MTQEVRVPRAVVMYECGEGRSELEFSIENSPDGLVGFANDDLYEYRLTRNPEKEINGTIFVRNRDTGEIKAVPVEEMLQIQKRCKRQPYQRVENAQQADLISNFGSRTAKKIYSQRSPGRK